MVEHPGHNGAGKTTLFNMLTGMTSVTSGKASIFGYDVRDENDMTMIRRMTGICPQHDVLFDELTPREHLQFFARIRGMAEREVPGEVEDILNDIDLAEKKDDVVKNLSGGQKRKLSVGVALIGDPKIIFLGWVHQSSLFDLNLGRMSSNYSNFSAFSTEFEQICQNRLQIRSQT